MIGIHQINYLPWLGYFNKLSQCDKFVFFDDVQLPLGKNYETRTSIKTPNGVLDLTIPILNKGEKVLIKDARMADGWKKKHLKSIIFSYQKSPYFNQYIGELEKIYSKDTNSFCEFGTEIIKLICKWLDIKTELVFSSQFPSELKGEERIIELIKKLGGTEYVSGTGSGSMRYAVPEHFKEAGIKLVWQEFIHPVYPQLWGEFKPNLSILDLIFNCGEYSKNYL